jgi:spore germination protein YaaH
VKYATVTLPLLIFLCFLSCQSRPVNIEAEREIPEQTAIAEAAAEKPAEEAEPLIELPPVGTDLPVSTFREVWAYVTAGDEAALIRGLPISDVGYFGAQIDYYGKLVDVPNRRKLPAFFSGRVHLVVACNSNPLTHFILIPNSAERKALIADLLEAAKNYDGLQIDFENIPLRDSDNFLSFLTDLRTGLGHKTFTVALRAAARKTNGPAYDYENIKPLVDRILIMAYDEHWSGSTPGPIASLGWCKRVAAYCLSVIGPEKLIMGIPFYGRAWGDFNPSRAYYYTGIERIMREQGKPEIRRENGIPTFDYQIPVSVTVYYEDDYSLATRMEMYQSLGVAAAGFWRLGQETPAVWKTVKLGQ